MLRIWHAHSQPAQHHADASAEAKAKAAAEDERDDSAVPRLSQLLLAIFFTVLLILLPAIAFEHWETDWSYFEAVYYCAQMLFTIGQ